MNRDALGRDELKLGPLCCFSAEKKVLEVKSWFLEKKRCIYFIVVL